MPSAECGLLLGKQTDAVQHQKALRYEQIHGFVSELRQHDGIGSEPLEWLIVRNTHRDRLSWVETRHSRFSRRVMPML